MKIPLQGEFRIVPTDLPESVKKELLQDTSPRYIWVALPKGIRQIGRDFPFVVLPIKITPEFAFKQCGLGVLCETEAEAKESMELLSQRTKESLVVVQSPGFGTVGKLANVRHVITEHSVRSRPGKKGKRQWQASEREIDKATGEVNVLRRLDAADEAQANRTAEKWLQEYEQEKKKYLDTIATPNAPPPPPRCNPLTPSDLKNDLPEAKWTALKRQWPHTFAVFEKRKAHPNINISDRSCQDAYLLDLVEQGYDPKSENIRGDLQLITALHNAAKRFAARGKSKITDVAIYLIAFNWELGWCYLTDAEMAKKLGDILKIQFTAGQVKLYRFRTLGLLAKHLPGPSPNSP
jgi:hypothetical protein